MFAGIGGFRSGLSHYGDFFVPVGYCEIDPYAKRAYPQSCIYLDYNLVFHKPFTFLIVQVS